MKYGSKILGMESVIGALRKMSPDLVESFLTQFQQDTLVDILQYLGDNDAKHLELEHFWLVREIMSKMLYSKVSLDMNIQFNINPFNPNEKDSKGFYYNIEIDCQEEGKKTVRSDEFPTSLEAIQEGKREIADMVTKVLNDVTSDGPRSITPITSIPTE